MILKILLFAAVATTTSRCFSSNPLCPDEKVCFCSLERISCICNNREDVTLHSFIKLNPQTITIEGCGDVWIRFGALLHLELEHFNLVDINKLTIQPFSVSGAQSIQNIRLENIADLNVEYFGLSGLSDVKTIILRNVTSERAKQFAFGATEVGQFIIEDSKFEVVDPTSFICYNMSQFSIINTKFGHLYNASILMHNIRELSVIKSSIEASDINALQIIFSDNFIIKDSSFNAMSNEMLFGKNILNFVFTGNVVQRVERNAFLNVNVKQEMKITNNIFHEMEENFWLPNAGTNFSGALEVYGNQFFCDCRISWLLRSRSLLFDTSTCINHKELKLAQLIPIFQSNETCRFIDNETHSLFSERQPLFSAGQLITLAYSVQIFLFLMSMMPLL